MMQDKGYFSGIIDDKTIRVLSVFLENKDELYHINRISEISKVPLATTFRIINLLFTEKIIEKKTIGKFSIYMLNDNKKTRFLKAALK